MIEIITTSIFVFSSIYSAPVTDGTDTTPIVPQVLAPKAATTTADIPTNKGIEEQVRNYFKDEPILADIARCESTFRQYDENGNILRGTVNKGDIGVMQINKYYHADKAKSLGYDLETVEGNMAYARYLYNKEGGQPWISSSKCWSKSTASSNQVAMK